MQELTIRVPDMSCRHRLRTVTASLRDVAGVATVRADVRSRTVVLTGSMTADEALSALDACGFPGAAVT